MGIADNTLVSIIVPTYNSEKFLEICLRSVISQSYSNIETIIVDNYSSDRTRDVAKKYATVVLCKAERSKARNVGINLARGQFVLSIDADMELAPTVVEECLSNIRMGKQIGGVIIPERSVGSSFWVRVRDFERSFYAGTEVESARFFRTSLVKAVGGYDENIVFFEESVLPLKIAKLGFNVKSRISANIFHYELNFSLKKWLLKKFYYGKTASIYVQKFGYSASKQVNILQRFSIFLKNRRFYSNPLFALGVIILKMLEYFSAGLGLLMNKKEGNFKLNKDAFFGSNIKE